MFKTAHPKMPSFVFALSLFFLASTKVATAEAKHQAASIANSQSLSFDVASIKPSSPDSTGEDWDSVENMITIKGYSLRSLVKAAYDLRSDAQIVGGPDWLDRKRFDITAKVGEQDVNTSRSSASPHNSEENIRVMLQTLLRERFKLVIKPAQIEMPAFSLVVLSGKTKLLVDTGKPPSVSSRNGHLKAVAFSMPELVKSLSRMREVGSRPVLDATSLKERYDFVLDWTPDRGSGIPADASLPELFTALGEQLGLGLKAEKRAVQAVQVVSAERPLTD